MKNIRKSNRIESLSISRALKITCCCFFTCICFSYKKCHFYWLLSSLNSEEVDEAWDQKMTKTSQCHESSQSQQSHVDHPFSNLEYFTNLNPENWQIISSLYLNHHVDPCRVRSKSTEEYGLSIQGIYLFSIPEARKLSDDFYFI